ncbi:MAG: hypothetical protein IH616_17300 [Gemmatimonadales bacterium]|nr:hypothetical protein [Gemmatimonadales bacterium]
MRQHFLRMRPGLTQRAMAETGFAYDASFGFSDRNGFRLGAADVVPAWDEAAQASLPIDEVPLIWMDRVLSKHQGREAADALTETAVELAERCEAVEGLWVGLWHPNMADALGFPDTPPAFEAIVRRVVARGAWVAPLNEIVRWRRARRALRARRVAPDGRVELEPSESEFRFDLRDRAGRSG